MAAVLARSMLVSFTISAFAPLASDGAHDEAEPERASNAAEAWLAERRTALARASRDYAVWDDTLEFTEGRGPEYLVNNLNGSSFDNLGLTAVVIGRPGATLVALQRGAGTEAGGELSPLEAATAALVLPLLADPGVRSGLVRVEDASWLYAAVPITRTDGSGANGMVWMSFLRIDDAFLSSPERLLSADIAFVPRSDTATMQGCRRGLALEEGFEEWDVVVDAHSRGARIPIAEEGTLIVELDSQVLDRALATFAPLLAERPGLFLTVNNSARRFESPDLPSDVSRALARHDVPGEGLILEVTETQFGRSEDGWARRVQELVDLGVRVGLDDFGAGYSSLGRLRQAPVAMLKLDRSFVVHLSEGAPGLAEAIIRLASALNLPVIAEGIETAEVGEQLTALDCQYGQGWHFGRPMPAETVATWQQSLPPRS